MNELEIKEVGKRIKLARKKLKLVQADVAKENGVSVDVIRNLENGRTKNLNMPIIKYFCAEHKININWILENEGDMFKETSTVDKLVREYNFSPVEEAMLRNYINLSEEERKVFIKYFLSLSSVKNQINVKE